MSERDDITEQAFQCPTATMTRHPAGMVMSEDGNMLNWEGLNYVLQEVPPTPSEVVQSQVQEASRGLDYMLELQSNIEGMWNRKVDPEDPEAVSKYVREVILCATDELHEVLAEVHWKPWKDKRGIKDVSKYREEMADVLHFILDLYLAAGLTGRDIVTDYVIKNYENLRRNTSEAYRAS